MTATQKLDTLDKLIAAVEAGEWDFSAGAPARQVFPYKSASADDLGLTARAAFCGSLDAALALHNALLPGWIWDLGPATRAGQFPACVSLPGDRSKEWIVVEFSTPACAWLLAILRAYRAQVAQ